MPLYAGHGRYFFRDFFGGQEAVTNVSGGHEKTISSLRIHIFRLKMCIFRLEIYISRLEI